MCVNTRGNRTPSKKVVMVAFHFPPLRVSSGLQRTLGFARHLQEYDWEPIVLTASKHCYTDKDDRQLELIPPNVQVHRAFGLDTARHLAILGRYPSFLAIPDRWVSWVPMAIFSGVRLVRSHKPLLLWSTYPIASSHWVAYWISRITGVPWVADFRDPMVEFDEATDSFVPGDKRLRSSRLKIEEKCAQSAAINVFCTASALEICRSRYSFLSDCNCKVISNGFDEEVFVRAEKKAKQNALTRSRPFRLLHSGTIYLSADRNPLPFMDAIKAYATSLLFDSVPIRLVLRATGNDEFIRAAVTDRHLNDIVQIEPPVSYSEAIDEMVNVDALVVLQGFPSNPAIPAKAYEYLRAGKPIFALVHKDGETARLLTSFDQVVCAPLDDALEIEKKLNLFLEKLREPKRISNNDSDRIRKYSRRSTCKELARVFDEVVKS